MSRSQNVVSVKNFTSCSACRWNFHILTICMTLNMGSWSQKVDMYQDTVLRPDIYLNLKAFVKYVFKYMYGGNKSNIDLERTYTCTYEESGRWRILQGSHIFYETKFQTFSRSYLWFSRLIIAMLYNAM